MTLAAIYFSVKGTDGLQIYVKRTAWFANNGLTKAIYQLRTSGSRIAIVAIAPVADPIHGVTVAFDGSFDVHVGQNTNNDRARNAVSIFHTNIDVLF